MALNNFRTGQNGLNLVMKEEGCRLKAYKLLGEKYYTIGYGHSYDSSITANTVWTQAQAESALKEDLRKFENYVNSLVNNVKLNQNQFDALISYTYNRGQGGLKQLRSKSNTIPEYSNNIVKYWGSAIRYKKALIERRKREKVLFDTVPNISVETAGTSNFNENCYQFQKAANYDLASGLKEDGIYGPATSKVMNKIRLKSGGYNKSLKKYSVGSTGKLVEFVQKRVGITGSSIDGKFGNSTRKAVIAYQSKHKLTADGIVGPATLMSMIV